MKPRVGTKTPLMKRHLRVRKKVHGTAECPRISVYRSLKHLYAQLVDDERGETLAMTSTKSKTIVDQVKAAGKKVDASKIVGMELARLAKEKNISQVVFDRGGYMYHGRVKAVAEGAREGGLTF